MTPSRTLQVLSLSWLFLGLVSVAALMLLIRTIPKVEWNGVSQVATSTAQEVSGSAIYNGLPVGQNELLDWIYENTNPEEIVSRKLAAYKAGRLQTGPRLFSPSGDFYVQLVNTSDPGVYREDPGCGYYGSLCDVIAGGGFHMMGEPVILASSGSGGSRPIGFADEDHIVLSSGFGDGPCGWKGYSLFHLGAATTTRELRVSECYWEYDPVARLTLNGSELSFATEGVPVDAPPKERTVFTTIRSNGKELVRLRRSSEDLSNGLINSFVTDPVQFFAGSADLEFRLENKNYRFRVKENGFELVR